MDALTLFEFNRKGHLLPTTLKDLLVFVSLLARLLEFDVVRPSRQPEVHLDALILLEVALAVASFSQIDDPGLQVALPLREALDDGKLNRER